MYAELKSVGSPDCENLSQWAPDCQEWSLPLWLWCGLVGGGDEESFVVVVCSVEWVRAEIGERGIFDGRHHIIVDSFKWDRIQEYLGKRVSACSGSCWKEVAEKLSRLGLW